VAFTKGRIGMGILSLTLLSMTPAALQAATVVYAGGTGTGHYSTVQAAVNALPSAGGTVYVEPGTYKEQVTVNIANVSIIGLGTAPNSVNIEDDLNAQESNGSGGTLGDQGSSTIIVTSYAKNFYMSMVQVSNTWTQEGNAETQAVALYISADRAVLRDVSVIGRQDTLYLGSYACGSTTCTPARQYLYDVYIEGNVDFIFGDGAAVLDHCTINIDEHGSASGETTVTAQRKLYTNYLSGYVFYDSTIESASSSMTNDYLGRPWGTYSTTIFINTVMTAPIATAGWIEFTPGTTDNLPTSYYAEYGSTGVGATGYLDKEREKYAVYLTSSQITQYEPDNFLAGSDGWVPTSVN